MSKNTMYPQEVAAYIALIAAVGFAACRYGNYLDNKNRTDKVQESVENNDENKETTVVNEVHYDEKIVNEIKLDSTDKYSTDHSSFKPITIEEAYEQILLEENPLTDKEIIESFNVEMEKYGVSIKSYSEDQHLLVLESNENNGNEIGKVQMKKYKGEWFDRFNELLNTLKVKKLFVSENVLLDCSKLDTSNLDEIFLGDFDKDTLDWIEYDKPMLEKLTLYCSSDRKIVVDLYSRSIKNIQIIGKDNKYQYDPSITLGEIDVRYETEKGIERNADSVAFYNVKTNYYDTEIRNLDVDNVKFVDVDLSNARSYNIEELENISFSVENKSSSVRYNPQKDDFDAVIRRTECSTYKTHDYSSLSNFLIDSFNQEFKNYGVELEYISGETLNFLYVINSDETTSKIESVKFYKEFNKLIKYLSVNCLRFYYNSKIIDFPQIEVEDITDMDIWICNPDESVYDWVYYCKPKLSFLVLNYLESGSHKINLYSSSIRNLCIYNDTGENNIELGNIYFTYYDERGEHHLGSLDIYDVAITKNTEIKYFDRNCWFYYSNDDTIIDARWNVKKCVDEEKANSKVLTK